MIYLISILTLVFVVLTIRVISKTSKIIKKNKGISSEPEYQGGPDDANDFNAKALLWVWIVGLAATIWSSLYYGDKMILPVASEHGRETDFWFWVSMILILVAYVLVNTFLFLFSYLYRHKKNRKATFQTHNNMLEIIWTTIPATVMTFLVLSGLLVWNRVMGEAPANSEVIEITGRQFAWMVRYSGEDKEFGPVNYKLIDDGNGNVVGMDYTNEHSFDDFTTSTELHVPKGQPVLLRIKARDVLHSVFIPHMRIKMDAVPGMTTKFWFVADRTTDEMRTETGDPEFDYEVACAEICGKSHFGMRLVLKVDEPADYEKWKREQKPVLTLNPDLLTQVPEKLKAKAMRYIEVEATPAADSTAVAEVVIK